MLVDIRGVQKYLEFCAQKANHNEQVTNHKGELSMFQLQVCYVEYQKLVGQLQQLTNWREKLATAERKRVIFFHDQKNDLSNHIALEEEFEDLDEINRQTQNTEQMVKETIKKAQEASKEFKEMNGMDCVEQTKADNKAKAHALLEEYFTTKGDTRVFYSPELADIMGDVADKKIALNRKAFEMCDELLTDLKTNKGFELGKHVQAVRNISEKETILDIMVSQYEMAWVHRDKEEIKKEASTIQKDGKHMRTIYENYEKVLEGTASKDEVESCLNTDYQNEILENVPKPRWSLIIQNAFRKLIGKPGYLKSGEEMTYHDRAQAMDFLRQHMTTYINKNNLLKSNFDKSIAYDIPENEAIPKSPERNQAQTSLTLDVRNSQEEEVDL